MNPETPAAPWWALYALGGGVLLIFAGGLIASFKWGNETQITTMLTATVTLATGMAGYFYGSSKGSERKDDIISRSYPPSETQVVVTPPPPAQIIHP